MPSVLKPSSSRAPRNCATLYRLSSAGVNLVPACSSLRMLSWSWLLLLCDWHLPRLCRSCSAHIPLYAAFAAAGCLQYLL